MYKNLSDINKAQLKTLASAGDNINRVVQRILKNAGEDIETSPLIEPDKEYNQNFDESIDDELIDDSIDDDSIDDDSIDDDSIDDDSIDYDSIDDDSIDDDSIDDDSNDDSDDDDSHDNDSDDDSDDDSDGGNKTNKSKRKRSKKLSFNEKLKRLQRSKRDQQFFENDHLTETLKMTIDLAKYIDDLASLDEELAYSLLASKDVIALTSELVGGIEIGSAKKYEASQIGSSIVRTKNPLWGSAIATHEGREDEFWDKYSRDAFYGLGEDTSPTGSVRYITDFSDSMLWQVSEDIKMQRFLFQKLLVHSFGGSKHTFYPFCRMSLRKIEGMKDFMASYCNAGTTTSAFIESCKSAVKDHNKGDGLVIITDGEFSLSQRQLNEVFGDIKPILILIGPDASLKLNSEASFHIKSMESVKDLNTYLKANRF